MFKWKLFMDLFWDSKYVQATDSEVQLLDVCSGLQNRGIKCMQQY